MTDIIPGLGLGREALNTHEYFEEVAENMAIVMMSDTLTATSVNTVTNKVIYKDISSFPTPKVEIGATHDYTQSWKRLQCWVIDSEARDIMFLLIHNKLPISERLFRIGAKLDPYCSYCPDAVIADIEHFFCACDRSKLGWSWTRLKIMGLCQQQGVSSTNWELLNLFLPKNAF